MSVKMTEYKLDDMNNFEKVCSHLVKFVKKTWNIKDLKPIGDKEIEKKALENFTGPDTSSVCANSCEIRLTKSDVEFSKEHGHDPVETLISSCIAYGMKVEQERQRRIHIFNTDAQAHEIKNHMLKAYADTYVQEDLREKFIEDMYDSFCVYTNFNRSNFSGFRYDYDFWSVAVWEGKFEEFLKYQEEEREKVSVITDQIIKEFKEKKLKDEMEKDS